MARKSCVKTNIFLLKLVVVIFVTTAGFISCKNKDKGIDPIDFNSAPRQVIKNMKAVQSRNGGVVMQMEADVMESYSNDTSSFELFPAGFNVYGYTKEGDLETKIRSDRAKHTKQGREEQWEATGNVKIYNYIKGERMETDTLYWNQMDHTIYTHSFVKMFSPQGYLQGFGMKSDEMAKNATILRPFNSYGIIDNDSTKTGYIDTVNLIGPIKR